MLSINDLEGMSARSSRNSPMNAKMWEMLCHFMEVLANERLLAI
jgi:hypothetical protein